MELWIRSQDKERLTTINDLRIYYASKEKVWVIVDCDDLGYYKTRERALEILDEIHQRLIDLQTLEITQDFYKVTKRNLDIVYEMPKE